MNAETHEALGPDAIDHSDLINLLWEDCDLEALFRESLEIEADSDYRLAA